MHPTKPIVVFAVNDLLVGGVQRLYLDLFKQGFPGYDVHLLTLFSFPGKQEWFDAVPDGIVVHRFDFKNFRDVRAWAAVARLLAHLRPGIIISSLFFSNTVTRVLGFFLRIRVITVEHNTYTPKTKSGTQVLVDFILAFVTYRIVAVSRSVLEFTVAREHIAARRFVLIHNGVDFERLAATPEEVASLKHELGLSGEQRAVISVGRLTAQKNQSALIEGFARFAAHHPEYKLFMLGEGSLRAKLTEYIRTLGMEGRIVLCGACDNLGVWYRMSDFFVSVAHIEGLSIAQLEALACGVPILATKTAGADEIVVEGKNGFFTAPDAASIAEGLERMAAAHLDSATVRDSVERFSITKTAAAYRALLAQVLILA